MAYTGQSSGWKTDASWFYFLQKQQISVSSKRWYRLWGPHSLLQMSIRDSFAEGKVARAWNSLLTSIWVSRLRLSLIILQLPLCAFVECIIIFSLPPAAFKAYCTIWVKRSNFRHQASPRVSPHDSTQRRKVELWARNMR